MHIFCDSVVPGNRILFSDTASCVQARFAPHRPVIAFGHLVQLVNSRSCGMRSICGFVVKLWDKFHLCSVIKSLEHGGLYWDFGVLNIFERVHEVLKFSKKFNEV